jgi:UTP--glucose-1-phosphate uridylyltransferase
MEKKTVEKAIFPIAGRATRFLPLSKVVSKELIPLVDKPLVHYNVEEALLSGIKQIQFVTRQNQKDVLSYFKDDPVLEKLLEEGNKKDEIRILKDLNSVMEKISFSSVIQKQAKGDVNAIYQSKDFVGNDPCAVFFCDDIIHSKDQPGLEQLQQVYATCGRPVVALKRLPKDKLSSYGVVEVEKIANSFYKIKKMVQKPKGEAPSDLAMVGRMILTPDVFEYIDKDKSTREKDFSITQVLGRMAEEGKVIYGHEIKGDWLECGNKLLWFKSFLTLAIANPEFGPRIKEYIKDLKI